MKLSLTNRLVCPPDGFRWVDPEDGFLVHAWSFDAWVDGAKHHLSANNRPIPADLEGNMQNQLCQTLPPGWCDYDNPNRPRVSTSFDWSDVMTGLRTFASWIAGGCEYVGQEEANRRALICSRCYLNTNVEGCSNCHKIVAEVTKNRHTKYDFALKACAACKCLLRAKVHFPIDTLSKSDTNQELYPDFCWLKKDGQNFHG